MKCSRQSRIKLNPAPQCLPSLEPRNPTPPVQKLLFFNEKVWPQDQPKSLQNAAYQYNQYRTIWLVSAVVSYLREPLKERHTLDRFHKNFINQFSGPKTKGRLNGYQKTKTAHSIHKSSRIDLVCKLNKLNKLNKKRAVDVAKNLARTLKRKEKSRSRA